MSLSTDWLMLWATDVYWNCRRPATGGLPTFWKLSIDLCICSHNRACGRNEDLFLTLYALSFSLNWQPKIFVYSSLPHYRTLESNWNGIFSLVSEINARGIQQKKWETIHEHQNCWQSSFFIIFKTVVRASIVSIPLSKLDFLTQWKSLQILPLLYSN
jgi:hypothetical protein